jgi:hypothetical protein
MQTLVAFKYRGVPMARLYAGKLDIFSIYSLLRPELAPGFDDDIFIQTIRHMNVVNTVYTTSDWIKSTTNVVVIPELSFTVKVGYTYTVEVWLALLGSLSGVDVAMEYPASSISRFLIFSNSSSLNGINSYPVGATGVVTSSLFNQYSGLPTHLMIRGTITPTVEGNLQPMLKARTAGQNNTIYAGSYMRVILAM